MSSRGARGLVAGRARMIGGIVTAFLVLIVLALAGWGIWYVVKKYRTDEKDDDKDADDDNGDDDNGNGDGDNGNGDNGNGDGNGGDGDDIDDDWWDNDNGDDDNGNGDGNGNGGSNGGTGGSNGGNGGSNGGTGGSNGGNGGSNGGTGGSNGGNGGSNGGTGGSNGGNGGSNGGNGGSNGESSDKIAGSSAQLPKLIYAPVPKIASDYATNNKSSSDPCGINSLVKMYQTNAAEYKNQLLATLDEFNTSIKNVDDPLHAYMNGWARANLWLNVFLYQRAFVASRISAKQTCNRPTNSYDTYATNATEAKIAKQTTLKSLYETAIRDFATLDKSDKSAIQKQKDAVTKSANEADSTLQAKLQELEKIRDSGSESFSNSTNRLKSNQHDYIGYYSFDYLEYANPNYWEISTPKNYYDLELQRNWFRYNPDCVQ